MIFLPHNPGDVILGLHTAAFLKTMVPHCFIDFHTSEDCRILVDGNPNINQVTSITDSSYRKFFHSDDKQKTFAAIQELKQNLSQLQYDGCINLFQEDWGGIYCSWIKSEKFIGLKLEKQGGWKIHSRAARHYFSVPAARGENPWHSVDVFFRMLSEMVSSPVADIKNIPELGLKEQIRQSNSPLSQEIKVTILDKKPIAIHPGSAWPGKKWPVKHWARLIDQLVCSGETVLITGSDAEKSINSQLKDSIPEQLWLESVINLTGELNLLQTWEAISMCKWLICGDTVAMHMGAASGIKLLALFGASNPVETGPYQNGCFIWRGKTDCPSRLKFETPDIDLQSLEPEEVYGFITHGKIPEKGIMWESIWENEHNHLVLRNCRTQEIHPFQRNSEIWDKLISPELRVETPDHKNGTALEHLSLLENFDTITSAKLEQLEKSEKNLAEKTTNLLIWEAYRINLAGIPIDDLRHHLDLRRQILTRAIQEEAFLAFQKKN